MEDITDQENVKSTADMTAGEMLRNARTTGRRKREIQTIAKSLCIREDFLQALENGNYTALPEVVYILGFARNYAIDLGLDPDVVVGKIKHELGLVNDCRSGNDDGGHGQRKPENGTRKSAGETKTRQGGACLTDVSHNVCATVVRHWKWVVGVILGLVSVILLAILFFGTSSVKTSENVSGDLNAVELVEPSEPAYTQPVRERFGIENRDDATIILQANKNAGDVGTWVQIEDARGKKVFSKIMFPGDIYYVSPNGFYRGMFGNVAGVDFWVGGKLAPTVRANRNTRVAITAENLLKSPENKE